MTVTWLRLSTSGDALRGNRSIRTHVATYQGDELTDIEKIRRAAFCCTSCSAHEVSFSPMA
jgi:hypothetical protein